MFGPEFLFSSSITDYSDIVNTRYFTTFFTDTLVEKGRQHAKTACKSVHARNEIIITALKKRYE